MRFPAFLSFPLEFDIGLQLLNSCFWDPRPCFRMPRAGRYVIKGDKIIFLTRELQHWFNVIRYYHFAIWDSIYTATTDIVRSIQREETIAYLCNFPGSELLLSIFLQELMPCREYSNYIAPSKTKSMKPFLCSTFRDSAANVRLAI